MCTRMTGSATSTGVASVVVAPPLPRSVAGPSGPPVAGGGRAGRLVVAKAPDGGGTSVAVGGSGCSIPGSAAVTSATTGATAVRTSAAPVVRWSGPRGGRAVRPAPCGWESSRGPEVLGSGSLVAAEVRGPLAAPAGPRCRAGAACSRRGRSRLGRPRRGAAAEAEASAVLDGRGSPLPSSTTGGVGAVGRGSVGAATGAATARAARRAMRSLTVRPIRPGGGRPPVDGR
jgi:hypothetical protein